MSRSIAEVDRMRKNANQDALIGATSSSGVDDLISEPHNAGRSTNTPLAFARRSDAEISLQELARKLLRKLNLSTKILALFVVIALVSGSVFLGFAIFKELK